MVVWARGVPEGSVAGVPEGSVAGVPEGSVAGVPLGKIWYWRWCVRCWYYMVVWALRLRATPLGKI